MYMNRRLVGRVDSLGKTERRNSLSSGLHAKPLAVNTSLNTSHWWTPRATEGTHIIVSEAIL
jgi:hypothetical protein